MLAIERTDRQSGLAGAIAWVNDHLEEFRLAPRHGDAHWATLKAVAELAHAALRLMTHDEASASRWLAQAWDEVSREDAVLRWIDEDPRYLPVAITYVPFALAGHPTHDLVASITSRLEQARLAPLEWALVVPAVELIGVAITPAVRERAREASVLARRPPVAEMASDAQYMFAHECFYATRWGTSAPRFDSEVARYTSATLAALLEQRVAANDPDLLAELVLASKLVGATYDARADAVLRAAQTADGNVVPRVAIVTQQRRFAHPTMARTYHTTLASLLAWS